MPPPDGAHAVGASLGRLRRPSLRAHRVPRPDAKRPATRSTARSLAELPYHPHIQHTDLGTTSTYLQGIDPSEILDAVRTPRPPTIPATAGLQPSIKRGHCRRSAIGGREQSLLLCPPPEPKQQPPARGSLGDGAEARAERRRVPLRPDRLWEPASTRTDACSHSAVAVAQRSAGSTVARRAGSGVGGGRGRIGRCHDRRGRFRRIRRRSGGGEAWSGCGLPLVIATPCAPPTCLFARTG